MQFLTVEPADRSPIPTRVQRREKLAHGLLVGDLRGRLPFEKGPDHTCYGRVPFGRENACAAVQIVFNTDCDVPHGLVS
jgi:hypothetical protein